MSRSSGQRRRYRKTADRRVWVFSELRHDLRPEQIASIITAAGLEQARLEAEAVAEHAARANREGDGSSGNSRQNTGDEPFEAVSDA